MLNPEVSMIDIDVDHWRNLQSLLLESASARPRIVLIHEGGELLKFVHSQGADIVRNVERVESPSQTAEEVYRANAGNADFVAVFERSAVDRYFARVQDAYSTDEDVAGYTHRMYATLDEYPDGIVTHPGPASETLGLQWRVGASYEAVQRAVSRFVTPGSSVVFGIFEGDALWASLVLGFDEDGRVSLVTTADTAQLPTGGFEATAQGLVGWVNENHLPCSIGLFTSLDGARTFLASPDKTTALRDMADRDELIADPIPDELAGAFAVS